MFSAITAIQEAIMLVIVHNLKFMMQNNAYGDETLEEQIATVIMMASIQPADDNSKTEPKYDVKAINEVNALHIIS
ncbi:hypothetical protein Tco_1300064 [Tanacetum coccineum]